MKYLAAAFIFAFALAIGTARAEEYPYRNPSYYRTVFVEAATKKCLRDEGSTSEIMTAFCECSATLIATYLTRKDVDEISAGGVHMTPRYRELADMADRHCFKAVTGKDP